MPPTVRVNVILPHDLVESIDRLERNRSRFIAEAVENEIARRRGAGLLRSLEGPNPVATPVAEAGLADWGVSLPMEDEGLIDLSAGKPVHWLEGTGWV
jgi:metal-responsive CopG/Arc/MetJ family transcriptional regulator